MEFDFENPVKRKEAFYHIMSKAKNVDVVAKAKFSEPPFYMQYLKSWTTRKEREDENARD